MSDRGILYPVLVAPADIESVHDHTWPGFESSARSYDVADGGENLSGVINCVISD